MADLSEKQFDLDGLIFGLESAGVEVESEGFTPGAPDLQTQDSPLPGADGVRFGKDSKGGATWGFSGFTNGKNETDGWRIFAEFAAAWDAKKVRETSRSAIPLRYSIAGQTRRVYGRPRRLTPIVNNLSLSGRIGIEADFYVSYPYYFDDVEQSISFSIGTPLDPAAGVIPPFIPPVITAAGATSASHEVWIQGDVPTPLVIKITGPVEDPLVVAGDFFKAQVNGAVEKNNPVTFDARPWSRSATTKSGGSVPVSPRVTQLSRMWLPPGRHEITFTGNDITSTATLSVSWRNANSSPR
jgi:hypothetical protein